MQEIWKPVKDFPNYEVSNFGKVRNLKTNHILKCLLNTYTGYYHVGIASSTKRQICSIHRLVANAFLDKQDGQNYVDHKNGNKNDNCITNLRWCEQKQNMMNQKKKYVKNGASSNYKGVSYDTIRKKWLARIQIDKKQINLGRYLTEEEAAKAYNDKAKECFGEFAKLNIIPI